MNRGRNLFADITRNLCVEPHFFTLGPMLADLNVEERLIPFHKKGNCLSSFIHAKHLNCKLFMRETVSSSIIGRIE